jgi:hypothetical protein
MSFEFKDIKFADLGKAIFRKYLQADYENMVLVTEVARRLVSPDVLEIYRVHMINKFFRNWYTLEKLIIDRKNKTFKSIIDTITYKEKCFYEEVLEGVNYNQQYKILINFSPADKLKSFKMGCDVINNISLQNKI